MSIRWMTSVWDGSPYDGARLLIHLAMADFANDDGRFFASQPQLAAKAKVSTEYVRLTVAAMTAAGLLIVERKGTRRGLATEYRLLTAPPNSVAPSDSAPPNSVAPHPPTLLPSPPNSTPSLPSYTTVLREEHSLDVVEQPAPFDRFWSVYPRKVGKINARKAWTRALAHADADTIIAGADRYARDPNRAPAYTAHPATWLARGSWDDDPLPARASRPGGTVAYLDAAAGLLDDVSRSPLADHEHRP